ncbi:hypothetical protein [Palleronia marisminoris]|uniref:hypothetical protein n=1 Tax=Palleronia marisminoris TaxID=315423 RepID=UPI00158711BA|nr:hypothetical protein [Palleronia marisminoris]
MVGKYFTALLGGFLKTIQYVRPLESPCHAVRFGTVKSAAQAQEAIFWVEARKTHYQISNHPDVFAFAPKGASHGTPLQTT